jgi:hypothetical protein
MSEPAVASHGAPQHDSGELRHTLSIHEVEAALQAAGVPRSHRQVIRYCETQMLDAVKVPGPTGAQWFVSPASLPKAIGDLKQWGAQRGRQSQTQSDMSNSVVLEKLDNIDPDIARRGTPQPAVSSTPASEKVSETQSDMSRYVALLERDNEFLREQVEKKDDQIEDLSQRFSETQTLLGAMQRMIAPLLGQADPFKGTQDREVRSAPDGQ